LFFLVEIYFQDFVLVGHSSSQPPRHHMEILLSASSGALATHPTTTTTATSKTSTLTNKIQDQVRVLDPKTGTALLAFRQSAAQRHGLVVVKGPGSSYTYGGGRGNVGCDHVAISQQDRPAVHFWSWGREQPRMRCSLPVHIGPMATTSDGQYLFGGTKEGRLLVWDTLTGELVQAIDAHLKAVSVVRVMRDNSHVITGGSDADVFVWSIADLLDGAAGIKTKKRKPKQEEGVGAGTKATPSASMEGTYVEPVCTWNAHTLGVTDALTGGGSTHGKCGNQCRNVVG
jgi:WD40 repeat protein